MYLLCKFTVLLICSKYNIRYSFCYSCHNKGFHQRAYNHQFNANEQANVWRSRFLGLLKSMIRYKNLAKETGVQKITKI